MHAHIMVQVEVDFGSQLVAHSILTLTIIKAKQSINITVCCGLSGLTKENL